MTSTPTLHAVTDRRFTARDFALERGRTLPEIRSLLPRLFLRSRLFDLSCSHQSRPHYRHRAW